MDSNNKGLASSGCLQCFCAMKHNDTFPADKTKAEDTCKKYDGVAFWAFVMNNALSYVIVGVNYVIRTIMICLISKIGYASETEQLKKITSATFYMLFFNTAFLLMLVNADMTEQPLTFGLTHGHYADFNALWWKQLGNALLSTMFINAIFPIVEFFMFFGLRFFGRWRDRGLSCTNRSQYNTKANSIQKYIGIYAGPEFAMHFKYSAILNITFVTFMFGLGLPLLFPYAILGIVVLWFSEKLLFFYSYRLPPMYGPELGKNVVNKMKGAPLFMFFFGYWFFSSHQLLSNDNLTPVPRKSATALTGHNAQEVFSAEGWAAPAWPMLLLAILSTILYIFGDLIGSGIALCFPSCKIGDVELDEDIDTYWNSLDDYDRNWSIKEEEQFRKFAHMDLSFFGIAKGQKDFSMMDESSFGNLKKSKEGPKTLQGTHSYDILANPKYYAMFNYIPVHQDEGDLRSDFIIDDDSDEGNDDWQSDKVRVGLNLGFLPERMARELSFTFNGKKNKTRNADQVNQLV